MMPEMKPEVTPEPAQEMAQEIPQTEVNTEPPPEIIPRRFLKLAGSAFYIGNIWGWRLLFWLP